MSETRGPGAVESTERALDNVKIWNADTKALITVTGADALSTAKDIDARQGRGEWCGLLAGMTMSIKDNVDVAGVQTTAGSKILAGNIANRDSFIVERLKQHGAVIVGKANLHEWVFGPTSQSTHYGPVRNPWDINRIPGGSSGGSGASLAAQMCVGSIGSDTGGSIRIPSSFCGVAGLRPTIGRISCRGSVPVSTWFDTVGPMARRVSDVARIFSVVAGYDPEDPVSEDRPVPNVLTQLEASVKGLRIGVPRRFFFDDLMPEVAVAVESAVEAWRGLGVTFVDIDLGDVERSHELMAFKVLLADAYNIHRERLEMRPKDFGDDVYARAMLGKEVTGAEYAAALRWREVFCQRLRATFRNVDAILTPTTPESAPVAVANKNSADWFDRIRRISKCTYAWSFAGVPVLAVPCGFDKAGLPLSLQIATPWFDEGTALQLGHALQKVTQHHERTAQRR